jgi:hypothetical protein
MVEPAPTYAAADDLAAAVTLYLAGDVEAAGLVITRLDPHDRAVLAAAALRHLAEVVAALAGLSGTDGATFWRRTLILKARLDTQGAQ